MTFTVPLCGSVPRDPEIIDRWVDTRTATESQHTKLEANAQEKGGKVQTLEEVKQERHDTIDPLEEVSEQDKVWVGFSRDAKGLFVPGGNVRAHLKDCAGVVGKQAKNGKVPEMPKVLNFRAKAVESVYIKENRLHILNGQGDIAKEATGYRDATLSVMTARGPRTCLKRVDYIEPAVIKATILLYPGEITRDWIDVLLTYGCVHGFGQDRSLQFGRYTYELGE
jgi:hypothetical protein